MLGVTLALPGPVLVLRSEAIVVMSWTLLRPGLLGVGLSAVVGETRPLMVLETRAETVTKL